jgi:hypothetical protein
MTLYTIAPSAHVLGTMGVAVAPALECSVLLRLRGGLGAAQARAGLGLAAQTFALLGTLVGVFTMAIGIGLVLALGQRREPAAGGDHLVLS